MKMIINETEQKMNKVITHLENELDKIRTGRANPSMLDTVMVEAYGMMTPIAQVALINVAEARQLSVKPFDPSTIGAIEKAIFEANLGFTPMNDGTLIRVNIPQLTEEKRREYVKDVKKIGEDNKVSIRNARHDGINNLKKNSELTDDEKKTGEKEIQNLTDSFNKKIDEIVKAKEVEVMTI
ncbi:MAG: ribosome recycling factor [Mycoplasmatales bacterium]